MQRAPVPQAVQACHDLAAWIIPQLEKFPRTQRFTLGEHIETKLFDVLEQLLKAACSWQKREALQEANLQLEMLRHFWRLSKTTILNGRPWSLSIEYWNYVKTPDVFGPKYQVRLSIAPVVSLPWKGLK